MVLTEDRERVKILLRDTITLLCKNGLEFKNTFSLEALIGVTLDDDDVFLMSINELVKSDNYVSPRPSDDDTDDASDSGPRKRKRGRKRRRSCDDRDVVKQGTPHGKCNLTSNTKQEQDEPAAMGQDDESDDENEQFDDDLLFVKQEVTDSWNSSEQRLEPSVTVGQHPSDPGSSNLADVNMMTAGNSQSVDWGQFASSSSGQFDSSMTSAIPGRFDPSNTSMSATQESQEGNQSFDHSQVVEAATNEEDTDTTSTKICTTLHVTSGENNKEKTLVCTFDGCTYTTPHRSGMMRHQRRHTGTFLQCPLCDRKYVERYDLEMHVANIHEKVGHICNVCGKVLTTRGSLRRHEEVHAKKNSEAQNNFQCMICDIKFESVELVTSHMELLHNDVKETWEADIVKLEPANPADVRKTAVTLKRRACKISGCSYSTEHRSSMMRHMRRHTNSYIICAQCGRKFIEQYDLKQHITNVHDKQGHMCRICGKVLSTSSSLHAHERRHADPTTVTTSTSQVQFQCSMCSERYDTIDMFKTHMDEHHPTLNWEVDSEVEQELARSQSSKNDKQRVPIYCSYEECEYTSLYRASIHRHVKKCHTKESFKCEQCEKQFVERYNLREHVRSAHGPARFVCDLCKKLFRNKRSLVFHQKKCTDAVEVFNDPQC